MSRPVSDDLWVLIHSMKKAEKRYFKLFAGREGDMNTMKMLRLFDTLDRQRVFDEEGARVTMTPMSKPQFANLKAHLYKRVLQSLRLFSTTMFEDVAIREQIDHAQILYNRSLYFQSQSILAKAKRLAYKRDNLEMLLEIFKWEKRLLNQTVGKGNQERVNAIVEEVRTINRRIYHINTFTNIAAQLNAIYLKSGFIKSKEDLDYAENILYQGLPNFQEEKLSFTEKIYFYDLMVTYYYYAQNFRKVHEYSNSWVELFEDDPKSIQARLDMYIKGINNLLLAQNRLMLHSDFDTTKMKLRKLREMPVVKMNQNLSQQLLKYVYVHEFNGFFMKGNFDIGVKLIDRIKPGLQEFMSVTDNHSRIILHYKLACLYFGNGDFAEAVKWLNEIINSSEYDIREDVLCFARILNLVAHFELGNMDVIDYYLRSTYRFLSKKDDLHLFQKYILSFLKQLKRNITEEELVIRFKKLRVQLMELTEDPFDSRAFIYFDIISWLDSKIEGKQVMDVIRHKAQLRMENAA